MIVLRENIMAVLRTALKGLLLGALVGTVLALTYLAILFAPPVRSATSEFSRVISLIFGLPTLFLLTTIDMFGSGAIAPYFVGSALTGTVVGAAAPILGRRVTLWPFVGLATAAALALVLVWVARSGDAAPQFTLIPAALYVAFVAWLAYRVRVGGVQ
jgi:hypothetical protein